MKKNTILILGANSFRGKALLNRFINSKNPSIALVDLNINALERLKTDFASYLKNEILVIKSRPTYQDISRLIGELKPISIFNCWYYYTDLDKKLLNSLGNQGISYFGIKDQKEFR